MAEWIPRISGRPGPRYLAIVEAIAESLERGRLSPGDRLPTQRALAQRLGLTVGTITRAYAVAERRGLVEGQVGRGTFVRRNADGDQDTEAEAADGAHLDFAESAPLAGPFSDVFERALVLAAQRIEKESDAEVGARAERAAARWLRATSGVKTTPDRLLLTRGAGLAFGVLAHALAGPGEPVAAEEVANPVAVAALRAIGVRPQPVIVDAQGMSPDSLELACWASGTNTVFVAPDAQQPTGARLDDARRNAIVELARRYDLWIVEDGTHAPLDEGAGPAIVNLAPERTYHVFAADAVLHPGLTLAGIVTPTARMEALAERTARLGAARLPLMAALFADWIEDGTAHECLSWQRREAARRRKLAGAALADVTDGKISGAGYGLWVRPAGEAGPPVIAADAGDTGITLADTEAFWTGRGTPPRRLFVGLSGIAGSTAFERSLPALAGLLAAG